MNCRVCNTPTLESFIDLGTQPLSNDFRVSNYGQQQYPLHMLVCTECGMGQLNTVVDPIEVFNDYHYFSSAAPTWVADRRALASRMINMFDLDNASLVVDIGSNDGYYLKHFRDTCSVLGYEPAGNVAGVAVDNGIRTEVAFWGHKHHAKDADLVNATNVLAHTPDMHGFIEGVSKALKPNGVATFEFPLFSNLIQQNQIDTIYHEHYSYINLKALGLVLKDYGLRMWRVEELPTHGGSVRVFACQNEARYHTEDSVEEVRSKEVWAPSTHVHARDVKNGVRHFLVEELGAIVGYGAPAKATVLCNYLGLNQDDIEFVVDDSRAKQGKLIPGTNIPVVSFEHLRDRYDREPPRHIFVFPWNLRRPIGEKLMKEFAGSGCPVDLVTAIPHVRIGHTLSGSY